MRSYSWPKSKSVVDNELLGEQHVQRNADRNVVNNGACRLAESLANYAHTLVRMKKFDQAVDYQKQSTDMFIAIFGDKHPHAINSRLSYAAVLKIAGR